MHFPSTPQATTAHQTYPVLQTVVHFGDVPRDVSGYPLSAPFVQRRTGEAATAGARQIADVHVSAGQRMQHKGGILRPTRRSSEETDVAPEPLREKENWKLEK